jgi:hypothetical protein
MSIASKRAAVAGDGWLTYFYRPEAAKSWGGSAIFGTPAKTDSHARNCRFIGVATGG